MLTRLRLYVGNNGFIALLLSCMVANHLSGDVSLGRYNKVPRMRVQKAENVTKALDFIASRGVKLTNIGPEGEFSSSPTSHEQNRRFPICRYHRWKPQAHSWNDMDAYSPVHDRRYKVRSIGRLHLSPHQS